MADNNKKTLSVQNKEHDLKIYRNHKDGVAYKLFSGKKESLSLYNSIMKTDYTNPDELEVVTLNSAIYIGRKNDNAIILHFNMLLTEFQVTFNPNMPLRTLIYVANEYEKYIAKNMLNLYSEYIQKIPTPHFVTLYYGSKEQPEKQILKLSEAYKCKTEAPELELMVTQYNVNPSYNEELKKRCPELDGYIKYVDKTRKYHKDGLTYEEAVKKSVDECIKENILRDFFTENKAEVISMTIFEYDEEEHMKLEREEQYRNWRDLPNVMTYEKYKKITDKEHLNNIKKNPAKYLRESGKGFFVGKDGFVLALNEELKDVIKEEVFKKHMKDILDYRTMDYYRKRYTK